MRKNLAKHTLFFGLLFGFLNFLAVKFYLFWTISWSDNVMHFLGGFFVYILGLFLLSLFKNGDFKIPNLFWSLVFVFVVGTLWEIFELISSTTNINELNYPSDTILDYIMDLLGGFVGYYFISKHSSENNFK
jgi:hypothetical protein